MSKCKILPYRQNQILNSYVTIRSTTESNYTVPLTVNKEYKCNNENHGQGSTFSDTNNKRDRAKM